MVDFLALNVGFFLGVFIRFNNDPIFSFSENGYISLLLFFNIIWFLSSTYQGVYNLLSFSSRNKLVLRTLFAFLVYLGIILALNGLIKTYYSRIFIIVSSTIFGVLALLFRYITNLLYKKYLKNKIDKNAIVIVGQDIYQQEVSSFLEVDINPDFQEVVRLELSEELISQLEELKNRLPISELYIPLSRYTEDKLEELSNYCDNNFVRLRLIIDYKRLTARNLISYKYNQTSIVGITLTPLDETYNALTKRVFDVAFSVFVMIFVFSWLYPLIAILIKLNSKGPVFFKQKRTGIDNKEFYCYKFRSMRINAEADVIQATANDNRITSIGKLLRISSLDEVPQFINVLKGEMSIIGPRPHMIKHTKEYNQVVGNFMNRHAIKPGITGLAQIKGYRGEIDDISLLHNRVRLDRFYVNNWTLLLDLKIVIQTVLTIFKAHK